MAAFSPDGKHLVTASLDETPRLWDVATGKLLRVLRGHHGEVQSVAFSPDGRWIATGSNDDTAGLWDAATGALAVPLLRGSDWSGLRSGVLARRDARGDRLGRRHRTHLGSCERRAVTRAARAHSDRSTPPPFLPTTAGSSLRRRTTRRASGRRAPGLASRVFRGGDAPVRSGAFSPDGTKARYRGRRRNRDCSGTPQRAPTVRASSTAVQPRSSQPYSHSTARRSSPHRATTCASGTPTRAHRCTSCCAEVLRRRRY
jgi:WD40 repeat protein